MHGVQRHPIEAEEQARDRRTASLAALAALLLLLVAGLFLVHVLHRDARVETCLMSGRADCDALASALR